MNFDISAMKLRAKSLVKQCGMTPALIEAMLWVLRVIAVMCGSLSTQNGSIGGYIISGVTTLLLMVYFKCGKRRHAGVSIGF